MYDNNTDVLRSWLIVLPIIFILVLAAVFLAFVNIEGLTTEQRLDYGTKAITTTGTIFAGIAVFINAFYAAKRAEAMDKSAMAANESAKVALKNAEATLKNAVIAEDKQITERFAKAIEQLGSEKIEVRLGAIYTLERIAKDSAKDHWTIMEVLTAFVRENALIRLEEENTETEQIPKIRTDIQAALTVIGRRNYDNEQENEWLDLRNVDLRGVDLYNANLQKASLYNANLQEASLDGANLQKVNFGIRVNLQRADLARANLQRAFLPEANLQKSDLGGANLQGAFLPEANLQGANLDGANLQGANLAFANLQGAYLLRANFTEVENLEQRQIDSARGDRTTILPDYLEYPKHWQ